MLTLHRVWMVVVGCVLACGAAQAETKVTVSGVHLCCGGCIVGVNDAVADIKDAKVVASQKEKTVTITAKDDATAQKVIDAIADAGYHGKLDSTAVKFPKVDVGAANVEKLSLSTHNCCRACTTAIKKAITPVDGVKSDTVTPKSDDFTVEGNFNPSKLVEALAAAGFHVQVKK